ncbi:MAG: DoxX family protein [Pirellulales bacterium]|nr:DoxX family protein [Pirellulales bacterium]
MHTGSRICGCALVALILLRLAVGWHFLSEGMAKFRDPNFSSEPLLLQAVGPLAKLFHQQVPGFHRWREHLQTPRLDVPLSAEDQERLANWKADYEKRRAEAKAEKKPEPAELPPVAAYQPWGNEIVRDWAALLTKFKAAVPLNEDQIKQADEILRQRIQLLADYLAEQEADIVTYRHELHRLGQMDQSPAAGKLPYLDERIAYKKGETRGMPGVWIADIRNFEQAYTDALRALVPENVTEKQQKKVTSVLASSTWLDMINLIVTWFTFGIGVLLLAGMFTRLASFAAAMFLLSILASQPPWVAGAELQFFHYQLVEFTALILLIATAAGRYGGLDFFIHSFFSKRCTRNQ